MLSTSKIEQSTGRAGDTIVVFMFELEASSLSSQPPLRRLDQSVCAKKLSF